MRVFRYFLRVICKASVALMLLFVLESANFSIMFTPAVAGSGIEQVDEQGNCPTGQTWDGSKCITFCIEGTYGCVSGGGGTDDPDSPEENCDGGYYWDGSNCKPETYTITLNHRSGNSSVSAIYEKYNKGWYKDAGAQQEITMSANCIAIPVRSGYIFKGYYDEYEDDENHGAQIIDDNGCLAVLPYLNPNQFTNHATIDAVWEKGSNTCNKITLDASGGTFPGYTHSTESVYAKTGTNFDPNSIYSDSACTNQTNFTSKFGSSGNPVSRSGYTYNGFYTNQNGGGCQPFIYTPNSAPYYTKNDTCSVTISGDTTFYAQWTPVEYTITYNLDGGTNNSANPAKYTIESTEITLNNPTKTGYTFNGWYDAATGGNKVTTIPLGSTGNKTLYAKWTADNITCSAGKYLPANTSTCATCPVGSYCAGGEFTQSSSVQGIKSCPAGSTSLAGATQISQCTCQTDYQLASVQNPNLLQQLKNNPMSFSVSGNPSYNSLIGTSGACSGPNVNTLNNGEFEIPLNGSFVYGQALCSAMGQNPFGLGTPDETNNGSICWCKITGYKQNSGSLRQLLSSKWMVAYNGTSLSTGCQAQCAKSCTETITNGSYSQQGRTTLFGSIDIDSSDLCTQKTYTVTYNNNGGEGCSSQTGVSGTALSCTPTRTGYKFDGWYTAANEGTEVTNITSTTTVYAHWTPNIYQVTLEFQGGSGDSATKHVYEKYGINWYLNPDDEQPMSSNGTNPVIIPTRTGYTFNGYWTAQTGGDQAIQSNGVKRSNFNSTLFTDNNGKFYAQWTPVEYTITYNLDGGTNNSANPAKYTIESTEITLNNPTKTGYTFNGWYDAATGGNKVTTIPIGSTGNRIFYAHWTPNVTYTVTYNNNGGSGCSSQTGVSGTALTCKPTKEGYTFAGWYDAATGGTEVTTITSNTTVYAYWENELANELCSVGSAWDIYNTEENFNEFFSMYTSYDIQDNYLVVDNSFNAYRNTLLNCGISFDYDRVLTETYGQPKYLIAICPPGHIVPAPNEPCTSIPSIIDTYPQYTSFYSSAWHIVPKGATSEEVLACLKSEDIGLAIQNNDIGITTYSQSIDFNAENCGLNTEADENNIYGYCPALTMFPEGEPHLIEENCSENTGDEERYITLFDLNETDLSCRLHFTTDVGVDEIECGSDIMGQDSQNILALIEPYLDFNAPDTGYQYDTCVIFSGGRDNRLLCVPNNNDSCLNIKAANPMSTIRMDILDTMTPTTLHTDNFSSNQEENNYYLNPTLTARYCECEQKGFYWIEGQCLTNNPNELTVTYSCGEGTGTAPANSTAVYNTSFTPATNTCTRTGYTFNGWNDGTTTRPAGTAFTWTYTDNRTFTAHWTPNIYQVTLEFQGGSGDSATKHVYEKYGINWYLNPDDEQPMSSNGTNPVIIPTRTGYTFNGYWTAQTGGDQAIQSNGVKRSNFNSTLFTDNNGKFYAHWTPVEYTITYELDGGINNSENPATYTIERATITLKNPTKTGYIFNGWYDAATGGNKVTTIPLGSTGNKTLYAHWEKLPDAEFTVTTTNMSAGSTFNFYMSAMGEFTVDWGDGYVETITRTNTNDTEYSHTYTNGGTYKIGFSGQATGYNSKAFIAPISFSGNSFSGNKNIAGISGSLGSIFGTLTTGDNKQPRFYSTFYNNTNLVGTIPETLFSGVTGAPASYMFYNTFGGCSGLTGSIPHDLFAGISGAPASEMFYMTFHGCSGLTGEIPHDLFAGISGAPANQMFDSTFSGCSGLTGSIPHDLFAGISGAPAGGMFSYTFSGCSGLTGSIPHDLFAGISGRPADHMFLSTFDGCSGLTGEIPHDLFAGISGIPGRDMFYRTFYGCSGLTGSIPHDLFAGISGRPADYMFYSTFSGCSGLTGSIPHDLFAGISGRPADYMFRSTFSGCSGLTGYIPYELFRGITGTRKTDDFSYTTSGANKLATTCPSGTVQARISTDPSINSLDGHAICKVLTEFNITYDYTNGGSGCENETYTVGTAKELTCIPTKTGYTFAGWYDSATGGNKITQITALDTGDKTLYAHWAPNTITCLAGTYLSTNATQCTTCPVNSYCAGGNFTFSETNTQGLASCPATYSLSAEGAKTEAECYRQCTASDVAHSKATGTFTGMFYSNNTNACEPVNNASCADGYHYKEGESLLDASIDGTGYASISINGKRVESYGDKTQSDYNLIENGTWGVTFGCGDVIGKALCSGAVWETPGMPDMPDESVSGSNCWCKITGYTPSGGTLRSLSSAWVFRAPYPESTSCSGDCARACAAAAHYSGPDSLSPDFRPALFGNISASPAICEANIYKVELDFQGGSGDSATKHVYEKYGINWYLNPDDEQPMSSNGTNPVIIPTRTGYTFNGYWTAQTGGDQAIQSNGVKRSNFNSTLFTDNNGKFYAQWTQCTACSAGTDANCSLSVVNNVCTYTTSCPAGYTINGNGTATPTCTANTITCPAGTYLPANTTTCSECPANSYCGGGSYTFSESNSQGRTSCPSGFGLSPAGSVFQSECYRQCTYSDVAHSKATGTFTGKFYSNNTNACEPVNNASCADGYHYKEGESLLDASIDGTGYASISINGKWVESYGDKTQSDYNLTENGTWGVTFGYGDVIGKSLCSKTDGIWGETGEPDESVSGSNCWCKITGYTPSGGTLQSLSSAWVLNGPYPDTTSCPGDCAQACAGFVRLLNADLVPMRIALFGSVGNAPAICEANDITIDWGNDLPTSCKYDGDITTPVQGVEKTGYTFKGWKFNKDK